MNLASRVVVAQAAIGAMCVVVFFAFPNMGTETGTSAGMSAVCALLVSWIPSAYYAYVQAQMLNAARLLMHGVLKTLLTVTLMAVCIVVVTIEPLGFFVTFAVMQLGYLTR